MADRENTPKEVIFFNFMEFWSLTDKLICIAFCAKFMILFAKKSDENSVIIITIIIIVVLSFPVGT